MDDLLVRAADEFALKIYGISKIKSSYILQTEKGARFLNRMPIAIKKIEMLHTIKNKLMDQGFRNIDFYYETSDAKPYFYFESQLYVLTDLIPGSNVNFSDMEESVRIAEKLAHLHLAARDVSIQENTALFKGRNLSDYYKKRIVELNHIKKWVAGRSHLSEFDVLFVKHFGNLKKNAEKALEALEGSNYIKLYDSAYQKHFLCHNSLKEEHIKIDHKHIYFTHFEECSFDCQVKDLAELLRRNMKNKNFRTPDALTIIQAYDRINTLSRADLDILKAILLFPEKYLRICNEYYNKRRTHMAAGMIKRLENGIYQKEQQEKFIKDFYISQL